MKARWIAALIGCLVGVGLAVPAQAAGTVTGTVTIDGDATPVSGLVYLCNNSGSCGGVNFNGGTYSRTAPDAGPYKLRIQANTLDGATVYYDGTPDGTPDINAATALDFSSDQGPYNFVLPQIGKLQGTVTDGNGPVANTQVLATRHTGGTLPPAITDANGFYSFGYVRTGGLDVAVQASANFAAEYAVFTMPATGTETRDLVMKQPAYLEGGVTDTLSGDPIANIQISLSRKISIGCPSACVHRYFYQGTVATDANGHYSYTSPLSPGDYVMQRTDAFGSYPTTFTGDQVLMSTASTFPLAVNTSHGLNVELTPGPVPCQPYDSEANTGPTLCGLVTDGADEPLRGILVEVWPADGSSPISTLTDPRGLWAVQVGDGNYRIRFSSGYARANAESSLPLFIPTFNGGGHLYDAAPLVTVADNQQSIDLVGLRRSGQVAVSVTGPGDGSNISTIWQAFDATTGELIATEAAGSPFVSYLPPDVSVRIRVTGVENDTGLVLLPQWVGGGGASQEAATIFAISEGSTSDAGVINLPTQLAPTTTVSIGGKPQVGSRLKARRGVWNLETGTAFTYEWWRSGDLVGTMRTYPVKSADKGRTLTLKITASNGDFVRTITKKVRIR